MAIRTKGELATLINAVIIANTAGLITEEIINSLFNDLVDSLSALTHTHTGFATSAHSHALSDVVNLVNALAGKAEATHSHSEYVQQAALTTGLAGKANAVHSHPEFCTTEYAETMRTTLEALIGNVNSIPGLLYNPQTGKLEVTKQLVISKAPLLVADERFGDQNLSRYRPDFSTFSAFKIEAYQDILLQNPIDATDGTFEMHLINKGSVTVTINFEPSYIDQSAMSIPAGMLLIITGTVSAKNVYCRGDLYKQSVATAAPVIGNLSISNATAGEITDLATLTLAFTIQTGNPIEVCVKEGANNWGDWITYENPLTFTPVNADTLTEGIKTLLVMVRDSALTQSGSFQVQVRNIKSAPILSGITVDGGSAVITTSKVVSIETIGSVNGATTIEYKIDSGTWISAGAYSNNQRLTDIDLGGTYRTATVYVRLTNMKGSTTASNTVVYSAQMPYPVLNTVTIEDLTSAGFPGEVINNVLNLDISYASSPVPTHIKIIEKATAPTEDDWTAEAAVDFTNGTTTVQHTVSNSTGTKLVWVRLYRIVESVESKGSPVSASVNYIKESLALNFALDGGNTSTNDAGVTLDASSYSPSIDSGTTPFGLLQYRSRLQGGSYGAWATYPDANHPTFILTGNGGSKTVEVEFRNAKTSALAKSDDILWNKRPNLSAVDVQRESGTLETPTDGSGQITLLFTFGANGTDYEDATHFAVSEDGGSTYGQWIAFAGSTASNVYTPGGNSGTRTFYVKTKGASGIDSSSQYKQIVLLTGLPSLAGISFYAAASGGSAISTTSTNAIYVELNTLTHNSDTNEDIYYEMRNDNQFAGTWTLYGGGRISYDLGSTGEKTVYIRIKNRKGTYGTDRSNSITYTASHVYNNKRVMYLQNATTGSPKDASATSGSTIPNISSGTPKYPQPTGSTTKWWHMGALSNIKDCTGSTTYGPGGTPWTLTPDGTKVFDKTHAYGKSFLASDNYNWGTELDGWTSQSGMKLPQFVFFGQARCLSSSHEVLYTIGNLDITKKYRIITLYSFGWDETTSSINAYIVSRAGVYTKDCNVILNAADAIAYVSPTHYPTGQITLNSYAQSVQYILSNGTDTLSSGMISGKNQTTPWESDLISPDSSGNLTLVTCGASRNQYGGMNFLIIEEWT